MNRPKAKLLHLELCKKLIVSFRESQHGTHKGRHFPPKILQRRKTPVFKSLQSSKEAYINHNTKVVNGGLVKLPQETKKRGGRLGVVTTFTTMFKGNAGQGVDMPCKPPDPA